MQSEVKKSLIDIVGEENYTESLIDMVSYSYDSSDHDHRPAAAVWVRSTEQVSRILKLAYEHGFPVTPRGAGTGLAGSAVPARGGIVLDLCRMNRILEIRIVDRLVIVEPGVVYADLEKALKPYGFFFPPDPASGKVCTLGGNVSTNAGGLRGAKYGVTRDYVLGLEVVLPDGRIMSTGSSCMKSVSGYDLTRLLVGSEGTLGIITRITLKISPRPSSFSTGLAYFSDLRDAGQAVADIMHSGIVPSALEILDENTIRALKENSTINLPDAAAILLVETDGCTEAETKFQMDKVMEIFKVNRASRCQRAESAREAEKLWQARKSISSVAAKLGSGNVSEDVTVPVSRIPDLLSAISGIVKARHLPFVIFGHAGDGNLHPKIMFNRSDPEEVQRVKDAVDEIFRLTCDLGGTLTGEHGIGLAKAPFMPLEHEEVAIDVMRSLKRLFDPKNILNPGKMNLE